MIEDDQLPFHSRHDDQGSQPAQQDVAASDAGATGPTSAQGIRHGDESSGEQGDVAPSDPAEALVSEVAATPTARGLYFLTNRMNLNGVLSSRLVAPRASFQKYYTDLLDRTPGWVPLLRHAPTPAQLEIVNSERGAGTPVIVEFPHDVAGKLKSDESVVYVPAVALSDAVAIHLSSERDLREHRARGYSNVHTHDDLLRVTPKLFESEVTAPATFAPPTAASDLDWRCVDRIRGAVNAAVAAVESGEQLALVGALLGASKVPATVSVPSWLRWLEIDDHAQPDARAQPDSSLPDHILFRVAYDVLGERDVAEAWSPNEVLDAVEARVRVAGLPDDAATAIFRNLGRVRAIVNVEVDFEPFRPSARALVSAKALLLVLLRPELDQLLAWSANDTGADDATCIVAALLSGRLRGLSRESTELRSRKLDDMTAAWAVRIASGRSRPLARVQVVANSRGTSLKVGGVEVCAQDPLLPDLASKYRSIAEPRRAATRVRVSRAMGWPIEHYLQLPVGATVETSDSGITIVTPAEVTLTETVEETGFVHRLEALVGTKRKEAAAALGARR